MTGQTRPSSEQLRLVSSKTGEHILDDYLEAAEKGNRTLPDLLSDLFNSSGSYYRGSGLYNWKGNYTNGVPYITGDTFIAPATYNMYVALTNFTASGNHAQEIIDNKIALVFSGEAFSAVALAASTSAATSATNSATSATNAAASATASATSASAAATTAASINPASIAITGGTITGITDLAIADGGTGASTAPAALTNLGITVPAAQVNVLGSLAGNANKSLQVNSSATSLVWGDSKAVQPAINSGAIASPGQIVTLLDGGTYTLPDFSGQPGFTIATAKNTTAVPTTVTTSDGWKIAPDFTAATTNLLTALNTTTPHGIWGGSTIVTPPDIASITLSSALSVGSVIAAATRVRASINLDANRILLVVVASSSNHFAVVYDKTTDTFGASVTFTASDNGRYVSLLLMGANSFVLAASDPTTPFNGKIIAGTVSGTTITLGTAYAAASTLVQIDGFPIIVKLTDTLALTLVNGAAGVVNVQALSISGTVITAGTAVAITTCYGPRLLKHSATEAIITYGSGTTSASSAFVRTLSVSGTTVTLNTAATITTSNVYGANYRSFDAFVEGQSYLWGGSDASNVYQLRCITVSGTTCTANSATTFSASGFVGEAASQAITLTLPTSYHPNLGTMPVNATTILLSIDIAGVRSVTLSGTAISVSGALSGAYNALLRKDFAGNLYMVDPSPVTVLRFSVSGGTLTALESVASSTLPYIVPSSTKHDRAIKYGGVWYSWLFSTGSTPAGTVIIGAISEDKWLAVSTTDMTKLKVVGPMT